MKKPAVLFFFCLLSLVGLATAQNRPVGGAFAAVPIPGQPAAPVTPTPTAPPSPGVARPATPQAPGAKPEEQLRIVADPSTNSLIIYSTGQEFQNIKNILKEIDMVPRQVLMDVLVAEVTLTDTESLGIAYEIFRGNTTIFNRTFPSAGAVINPVAPATGTGTAADIIAAGVSGFPSGISGIAGRSNAIRAFINALATQNRIRTLASPSVLATDNRPARIQVGSEIPILTSQSQSTVGDSPIVNSVQYRNTGVILTIIPQVNSQGLVHLQVKQEVSNVGSENFGKTNSPSFDTRDAETSAVVQDGETLAIGGIIAYRRTRDRSGIPYLMDLPVLGRFFGTTSDNITRTELVILITPHVIRNKEEARDVTAEFKNKLSSVRNELERMRRDREMDIERVKRLRPEPPTPALPTPPAVEPQPPPVTAPARQEPISAR
jgi:general secretion pathway protein D